MEYISHPFPEQTNRTHRDQAIQTDPPTWPAFYGASNSSSSTSPPPWATSPPPNWRPRRPTHKLHCPACGAGSASFRSEHELRRHANRVHARTRTVWVAVDGSADGTFLARCKACREGKRYNECYNAASHLRRMHFFPTTKRGAGASAAPGQHGKDLGRGPAKGEPLEPSMEVLKARWLKEVEVEVGVEDGGEVGEGDGETERESPVEKESAGTLTA